MFIQYHERMTTDQIAVALLGVAAAWLSQARGAGWRRWACVFGLLGQPLWLFSSWAAGQWALFTVAILFTLVWLKGLWVHWIAVPRRDRGQSLGTIQITPGARRAD